MAIRPIREKNPWLPPVARLSRFLKSTPIRFQKVY